MNRSTTSHRCALLLVVAGAALLPRLALAQRSVAPLAPARLAVRIVLPEVLAVSPDTAYLLLIPALYERRTVYRLVDGEWTISEPVFQRDSARGARSVVGQAVGLYAGGQSVGAGRVRQVAPGFCGDPPAWCPTRAVVDIVGTLSRSTPPLVAVSPPPPHSAPTVDPTDDEVAAATEALFAVFRAAAARRAPVREDQMPEPTVFVVDDIDNNRRLLVAAASLDLGGAGSFSGLVVGIAAEAGLRSAVGRAGRLGPGYSEELRLVTAFDLNADGRDELLLGWVSSGDWRFEILSPDRLGRFAQHWRGPDRTPPSTRPRR